MVQTIQLKNRKRIMAILAIYFMLCSVSCNKDYEAPSSFSAFVVDITPKLNTEIAVNREVHFTDVSRGVKSRKWTFPGSDVASVRSAQDPSTDNVIHLTFKNAGQYQVRLELQFDHDIPGARDASGNWAPGFKTASSVDTTYTINIVPGT
ncbi:MAG: hypothetical protein QM594_10555 [Niabella sp.]